jgi:hypothetical protein
MNTLRIVFATVSLMAVLAGSTNGNLIVNGDFSNAVVDHPSDVLGPGMSDGTTNFFVDGWTAGAQSIGVWPGSGGIATTDTQSPGGNALGITVLAPGIVASPVDGNGTFIGIGRVGSNAEYSAQSIGAISGGEYSFSYYWATAGSSTSTANGTGQVRFFIDTDNSYPNGGRVFEHLSTVEPFLGPGNQPWHHVSGSVTLSPGSYFVGFTPNLENSYVVVDRASFVAVPEPTTLMMLVAGMLAMCYRLRASVQ